MARAAAALPSSLLLLLLGLVVVRGSAGGPPPCSGEQCDAEREGDPQSLLSLAAWGADLRANVSLHAPGITVREFKVHNQCKFDIDLWQWGAETGTAQGGVHKFPRKFGWLTVKAGATTPPLTRPHRADLMRQYPDSRHVRGCETVNGVWPNHGLCYVTKHIHFRRSAFGGERDGVEVSGDFLGSGSRLGPGQVPNLCAWYGYSFAHKITAFKPGTRQPACQDAGASFMGHMSECEKSGGRRTQCTTEEGEAWGRDGARNPKCVYTECAWPNYRQNNGDPHHWKPGSVGDCDSNPVGYLRERSWCINGIKGQFQYSQQNCLCPDPKGAGCNAIQGYYTSQNLPDGKPSPCWYPIHKMQKAKKTCEKMKHLKDGPGIMSTNFGFWWECSQRNQVIDVELELCPDAPGANQQKPDPCPIDYPFKHP